ncbi:tyrosine-protein kinase FRK [Pelomyxa schiedti]|nr:tyrosine-protein kinase FRK [Pelomyxa schiedti]
MRAVDQDRVNDRRELLGFAAEVWESNKKKQCESWMSGDPFSDLTTAAVSEDKIVMPELVHVRFSWKSVFVAFLCSSHARLGAGSWAKALKGFTSIYERISQMCHEFPVTDCTLQSPIIAKGPWCMYYITECIPPLHERSSWLYYELLHVHVEPRIRIKYAEFELWGRVECSEESAQLRLVILFPLHSFTARKRMLEALSDSPALETPAKAPRVGGSEDIHSNAALLSKLRNKNLIEKEMTDILCQIKIPLPHAQELAASFLKNGVDTLDALEHVPEGHFFVMGASVGDQAKIRSLFKTDSTPVASSFIETTVPMLQDCIPRQPIGKGAFGQVFKGEWGATTAVAMKTLKGQHLRNDILIEAAMLSSLRHPNVIGLYGICEYENNLYLVTELADGSVSGLLSQRELPLPTRLKMARDAAAGMQYLASYHVVHRDLACRNLLYLERSGGYIVKVADFGLARARDIDIAREGAGLRPYLWMALEALLSHSFSEKSDVWSMGVVLWELISHHPPAILGYRGKEFLQFLQSGKRLPQPNGCPSVLYDLMLQCWTADPLRRPTFKEFTQLLDAALPTLALTSSLAMTNTSETHEQSESESQFVPSSTVNTTASRSQNTSNHSDYSMWPETIQENASVEEKNVTCAYVVNANDVIILVEPIWDEFLQENQGTHLQDHMLNTSLWRWVSGPTTQFLYKLLIQKVRDSNKPVTFKFRCDASSQKRFMEMHVVPLLNACVQFRSVTRFTMARPPQILLEWGAPRGSSVLNMCTFCKKVQTSVSSDGQYTMPTGTPNHSETPTTITSADTTPSPTTTTPQPYALQTNSTWLEVEQAVACGLFECGNLPQLRHSCCPACFNYLLNKTL